MKAKWRRLNELQWTLLASMCTTKHAKQLRVKVKNKHTLSLSQLQTYLGSTMHGSNTSSINNYSPHVPSSMPYKKGKWRRLNACHSMQAAFVCNTKQEKQLRAKVNENYILFPSQPKMPFGSTLCGSNFLLINNSSSHILPLMMHEKKAKAMEWVPSNTSSFSLHHQMIKAMKSQKGQNYTLFPSQLKILLGPTLLASNLFSIINSSHNFQPSIPCMKGKWRRLNEWHQMNRGTKS